jgi:hypothetical protein
MYELTHAQGQASGKPPRNRRFRVNWTVAIETDDGGIAHGRIVDISTTGLQIQVAVRHLVGKSVRAEIRTADGERMHQTIKVVRIHEQRGNILFYGARIVVQNSPVQGPSSALLHDILLKMRRKELAPDFGRKRC